MLLALAPMVDLTHAAFRELVASYGGCNLFFTEMVNVRYLKQTPPQRDPYLKCAISDRPLWVQLVGKEVEDFKIAVKKLNALEYIEGYNLNLGCVKGKIQRFGWGASLLQYPEQVKAIIGAIKEHTEKPVSVKMRIPRGEELFFYLLEIFEEAEVAFIVIHPRTPDQGFTGKADWSWIKKAKAHCRLPIIGNGDLFSPQEADRRLKETGCDGLMFGRAALIRPWILRDTHRYLREGSMPPPPPPAQAVLKMAELIKIYLPQQWWEKRMDNFLRWFLQNFSVGLYIFKKIRKLSFEEKVKQSVEEIKELPLRQYPVSPFF